MRRLTIAIEAFFALLLPLAGNAQTIRTFVGGGPNNIPATLAALEFPLGMATDANGNLYFAAGVQGRVFKVDASGVITVVAGDGLPGFSGDGGPATSAQLKNPSGVVVDSSGNVFIADLNNEVIRKVAASTGIITTVAGNGTAGFSGDGGLATSAQLNSPGDIAVDSSGNLYITDGGNQRIRKVTASTGIITTVAGNGTAGFSGDGGPATSAELNFPSNVAVDSSANLFIDDAANNRIRKVTASTGIITTVAGNGTAGFSGDGGPAASAELNGPTDVAVDSAGNLFIGDAGNARVREVAASTGIITTVAGNGTIGFSGDGGPATSAELSSFLGVTVDPAGNLFISDAGNIRVRQVSVLTAIITTFAGNGSTSFGGDGFAAAGAQLFAPEFHDGALDSAGNLFISDAGNNRVREVSASTGIITTFAGNGTAGFSGDGGPATSAEVNNPLGVAVDSAGNIFIADDGNVKVRKVTASTGIIATVAGTGTLGFSGDGGPATSAQFDVPIAVAVDSSGNLFIADNQNQRIREVAASTGIVNTVAGSTSSPGFSGDGGPAISAVLNDPLDVAVDSSGNFFIADSLNQRIRKVTASTGIITTVAGNGTAGFSGDGGPATSAELNFPFGVAVDSSGNIFICDNGNQRIRKVTASTGIITTVAGNGTQGFSGDGGLATNAELSFASGCGVTVDSTGDIFISDGGNQRVREVTSAAPAPAATLAPNPVSFGSQPKGTHSAVQTVILTNSGTSNLSVTAIAFSGANAVDFSQSNTCGILPAILPPSSSCDVNTTFTPSTTAAETASLVITDDASNSPQSDPLSGTGTPQLAPAATLSPTSVPVGNEIVGTTSAAQTVTITNTGSANLSITAIAINGPNSADFHETNTCGTLPATVTPSNSCNISVSFTPSTAAAESASLAVTDNASNSPQSVPLTGNGTDFSFGAAGGGSTSATVTAGQPASYNLQINPVNGFTGTVSLTCTGAPTAAVCSASPSSPMITGATAAPFTVTVTTTKRGITLPGRPRALPRNFLRLWSALLGLLLLLLLSWAHRKKSQPALRGSKTCAALLAAALGLVFLCAGCGGGSSGSTGTPAGTYTLTVSGNTSGASGSATRTLSLTLNVN